MKSYKTYAPEDFAQEHSFINWVLGKPGKDHVFWEAWIEQHPEREEDVEIARQLVLSFTFVQEDIEASRKAALWSKIDQQTAATVVSLRKPRKWMAYAATVAILVAAGTWFLLNDSYQKVITQNVQLKTLDLPDGSVAELNAASTLKYQEDWSKDRYLDMEGEVFFEVKKGNPFVVNTKYGQVRVLGTSFNVFARATIFEVVCHSGIVEIMDSNGRIDTLRVGQKGIASAQGWEIVSIETESIPGWIPGEFNFTETPLKRVFDEMERQFGVEIEMANSIPTTLTYNGTFQRNGIGIDEFIKQLEKVCFAAGLSFENKNNVYLIRN